MSDTKQLTVQERAVALTERRNAMASREKTLKNLQWAGKLTPAEKQVLYHATKAYGLDPALREILVLGGNMYVTVGGRVRIAERSGQYAGCRYEELPPLEEGEHRYRCIVKKAISVNGQMVLADFEGIGRASPANVQSKIIVAQWLDEMAQKRALGRALAAAWPVNIPTWEEAGLDEKQALEVSAEILAEAQDVDPETGEVKPMREPGEEG